MMLEKTMVDTLAIACACETWFGAQPQGDDESPSALPVVIVNRPDSAWIADFCGTDPDLAIPLMQVDYWAETAEAAKRLSDVGRTALIMLNDPTGPLYPVLQTEDSTYEPIPRAWRVMQRWVIPDYQPALP